MFQFRNYSKTKVKLGVIIVIYVALAVTYSVVVPIGRGADEWAHYWYAQFIADNGRLPASPAEREAAGYKSDWPPLYHALAAGLTGWIDTTGPPTFSTAQIAMTVLPTTTSIPWRKSDQATARKPPDMV